MANGSFLHYITPPLIHKDLKSLNILLLILLSIAILLCWIVASFCIDDPISLFTTEFTEPGGLYIGSYNSLESIYVNTTSECAAFCIQYDECISFSFIPLFAVKGSNALCIIDAMSNRYERYPGGGGGYYHRLRIRDDSPYDAVLSYNLTVLDHGILVKRGLFRDVIDGLYLYLTRNYNVDNILYWYRKRAGINPPGQSYSGWETALQGSVSGLFLMGAGGILRWEEHSDIRNILNAVVSGISQFQMNDGFMSAFPPEEIILRENPNYVTAWQTHGLLAAHKAGNPQALPLLRKGLSWFNNNTFLPLFLPPNGGPETWNPTYSPIPPGYPGGTGSPDQAWNPNCSPFCLNHHYIYLQYQGMIKHSQMALSELGTIEDLNILLNLYQEDWWLDELINLNESAIWLRHWYPHNYELTAFESYLDMYILTGNETYLNAILGGWQLFVDSWIHVGGSIAINEGSWYPPKSYFLDHDGNPTGETCGSSFWIKINQRLHLLFPNMERYVYEIERSLFNVIAAAQGRTPTMDRGGGIRYFANLHGFKDGSQFVATCCEGQSSRIIGSLPEYIYTMAPDGIYIDLFIPSILNTTVYGSQFILEQLTEIPLMSLVEILIIQPAPVPGTLYIRIPIGILLNQ